MSRDEYGLVMPFLPVQSKGGPHDDNAYVAGYQMGLLDAELASSVLDTRGRAINIENREQADLIAMRHGYLADFTAEHAGFLWMRVRLADQG